MERYWFYIYYTNREGKDETHYDCAVRSSKGYAKRILEKDYRIIAEKLGWSNVKLEYHESDILML